MSRKLAPFGFIMTIVLLMTSLLPAQVAASSDLSLLWEKEFNGEFYNETAKTSENGTLMSTYEIKLDSDYYGVYHFDFMKIDASGNQLASKQLKNGQTKIFEYDGHGYIAFMNYTTKNFELYDENFKTLIVQSTPFEEEVEFVVKDDLIAITPRYPEYDGAQGVFYSLKTFKEINPSEIPIDKYMVIHRYPDPVLGAVTFANTVVKDVPLNTQQLNAAEIEFSENYTELNGYIYIAADVYAEPDYKHRIELLKIDKQGNIADRLQLQSESYGDRADSAVIINDKIIFALDQYYEYDLATFDLIKTYSSGNYRGEIGKFSNDLYYYRVDHNIIVADAQGNKKYTVPYFGWVSDDSDKYFIAQGARISDWDNDWTEYLYDISTGNKVLGQEGFGLSLQRERVISYGIQYVSTPSFEGYKNIVKLYGEKSDKPVEEAYSPNKTWTITFNKDVNPQSVSGNSIYVLDKNGQKIEGLTFTTKGNKVEIHAPTGGYQSGETYTLQVTSDVQSAKEISLKNEETKLFKIQ